MFAEHVGSMELKTSKYLKRKEAAAVADAQWFAPRNPICDEPVHWLKCSLHCGLSFVHSFTRFLGWPALVQQASWLVSDVEVATLVWTVDSFVPDEKASRRNVLGVCCTFELLCRDADTGIQELFTDSQRLK
jgi:hypothetical protein